MNSVFAHTNIVAHDWRALANFYVSVFGCQAVPPERHYQGDWITKVTGLDKVCLEGIHLRLPGHGPTGPTLEIFTYDRMPRSLPPAANRPGFGHIAFRVDDVVAARQAVLDAGGDELGQLHTMDVPGAGKITLIYMTDPEGNIVELQKWS